MISYQVTFQPFTPTRLDKTLQLFPLQAALKKKNIFKATVLRHRETI